MTNQHGVVARRIQLPVGFVSDSDAGKMSAPLEFQRLFEIDRLGVAQWPRMARSIAAFEGGRLHKKGIFYAVGPFKARHFAMPSSSPSSSSSSSKTPIENEDEDETMSAG